MPTPSAVLLPALCLLAGPGLAQHHVYSFPGRASGENQGRSVRIVGDVDKDGFDDVIAGAPLAQKNGQYSGAARVWSGANGALLYEVVGGFRGDFFGWSVGSAGDANNDGYADFIVGAHKEDTTKKVDAGSATLFSGKTGTKLHKWLGNSFGDEFGWSVAAAGDVDRDGWDDVIVGAPQDDKKGSGSGSAYVYSGKDYKQIYEFNGRAAFDNYGWSVRSAGDVDKDGWPDLIIGTRQLGGNRAGYVEVRSGKTGAILWFVKGTQIGQYFGASVDGAGDIDKDRHDDFIVGAYGEFRGSLRTGAAHVYSGKTGKQIRSHVGDKKDDEFGYAVAGCGDIDNDGYADVIVGAPGADGPGLNAGIARVFSGRNGSQIIQAGGVLLTRFGSSVDGGGHVNGDRYGDVVIGAPNDNTGGGLSGLARVISPAATSLSSDRHVVSLAKRQTQVLTIHAGAAHAGKLYFLLGTMSGTKPGIQLPGHLLPLNLDAYMQITLAIVNSTLLAPSLAKLDANGNGSAKFKAIPQLPASLIGKTLYHAYVVMQIGSFDATSVAVPVTIAK